MTVQFPQLLQRLAPGSNWVMLCTLDCSPIGGGKYYWTPGPLGGANVVMGGITYTPLPIEFDGLEWNGQGPLPNPTLRVSNVTEVPMALVIGENDLLGAQVTVVQTFLTFLDGQPNADPSATTEPAVFRIDRKSHADKNFVEFTLAAVTDQQGKQLPQRLVLQGACTQVYRILNASGAVTNQPSCPYSAAVYFTAYTVTTTDPTKDVCGRRLRDCVARFGATTPLPTYAFPGVSIGSGA